MSLKQYCISEVHLVTECIEERGYAGAPRDDLKSDIHRQFENFHEGHSTLEIRHFSCHSLAKLTDFL